MANETRIGRYEVTGLLGRGGFATVYRARDTRLNRDVALKVLLPHLAEDEDVRERFLNEARAIARLSHPNIIAIYEADEDRGVPYFVMPVVEGHSLRALLQRGVLPLERAVAVLDPLADAIDYLHSAGIVHRDIKPANVMIADSGHVVLMDFGISRALGGTRITRSGQTLGTPEYMAPEQVRGDEVGTAADIYALGVLAYHVLAGQPPFVGDSAYVLHAQIHDAPPPLQSWRPDLPAGVCAAVDWALQKDAGARPASAAQLLTALSSSGPTRALSTSPTAQATVPFAIGVPTQRTRVAALRRMHPAVVVAGAVLAAGMLLAAAILTRNRGGSGNHPTAQASTSNVARVPLTAAPSLEHAAAQSTTTPASEHQAASPQARVEQTAQAASLITSPQPTASPAAPVQTPDTSAPLALALRQVSTVAGSGGFGSSDSGGFAEGPGSVARFAYPQGVAVDGVGNLYVPDLQNHRLRKITPDGIVSTLAGSGVPGLADGCGAQAEFHYPAGVAVDAAGNVYVADYWNQRIRKVTPGGCVTTLAGSGPTGQNAGGYADGPGTAARFNLPAGLAVDAAGNVYVADLGNNRVRRIAPNGTVSTIAGDGRVGYVDGPASTAEFNGCSGVAVAPDGTVYVADVNNNRIRRITPRGIVDTFAGSGIVGLADGPAATARFNGPTRLALDAAGDLFVADLNNQAVRAVRPDGTVVTIAGGAGAGYVDAPVASARFDQPEGLAVDAAGNIYVADADNNRIRRIAP